MTLNATVNFMRQNRVGPTSRPTFQRHAILSLLSALVLFNGCQKKQNIADEEKIPVRIMRVDGQNIKHSLDYAGNILAQDEALVYPRVAGKIIAKLKQQGDHVAKGEVIATIDRDEVGFKFEHAPVESPMAGLIGRVHVDIGTSVTPQTPLALVVDIESVEIMLHIPERHIPQIHIGQTAELTVDAWPELVFTGQVSRISPVFELETRTSPVEIVVPNPKQQLKPGMFARVRLILEERRNVPVIPREAVLGRGSNTYVYVAAAGTARQRDVLMGLRQGASWEVLQGLQIGEMTVILGQQRLHDGAAIRAEE